MAPQNQIISGAVSHDLGRRERLSTLNVLVADRDHRTASLVQRLLFSFGFRSMDLTTNGESALTLLRSRPYDILITEWNMAPVDGVQLVRAIRSAKDDKRIPRDIPILMLTAQADKDSVTLARDAGITEFVAKPFSAKTISNRIIQIIDNPRSFVETSSFVGPDRRRKRDTSRGNERRIKNPEIALAPNHAIQRQLGDTTANAILNTMAITQAQAALLEAEDEFIIWAHDDILRLEKAFEGMKHRPANKKAHSDMMTAAYAIKSQAGIFGYPLGTEVAALLVEYLESRKGFNDDNFLVISKHIETISLIFKSKIKESGQAIAMDMLHSLKKLIKKLG